jgi:hypothetical protein
MILFFSYIPPPTFLERKVGKPTFFEKKVGKETFKKDRIYGHFPLFEKKLGKNFQQRLIFTDISCIHFVLYILYRLYRYLETKLTSSPLLWRGCRAFARRERFEVLKNTTSSVLTAAESLVNPPSPAEKAYVVRQFTNNHNTDCR